MEYQASLDYLFGLQRFGIKLGLENIRTLLQRLGDPQQRFPVLHIAGSNGKGSTAAALAAMLQAAGLRTGLYTSPHLHSFTERIRVDGECVAEEQVAALTAELRSLAEGLPVTFFEFTTALALEHFRRAGVAVAVLETGMGGRLDATNAVRPEAALITPISCDHEAYLGSGLTSIAAEKAGIIKSGVPVFCAPQEPEVLEVLQHTAGRLGAPLYYAGRDWQVRSCGDSFDFSGFGWQIEKVRPSLAGGHQHQNFALALATAAHLASRGWALSPGAALAGTAQAVWPGRLEWWPALPDLLLDGAHNDGGMNVLADYLAERGLTRVHWVVGVKGDKDRPAMLSRLASRVTKLYCTPIPVEEGARPEAVAATAAELGLPAECYPGVGAALQAALDQRRPGEPVLVAGSLFLVAAAREWLLREPGQVLRAG